MTDIINADEVFDIYLSVVRSESRTIALRQDYIDLCERELESAVLLSQIMYWEEPDREGKSKLTVKKEGVFWIAKTREEWVSECRFKNPYRFDQALKHLLSLEVIEIRKFRFNGNKTTHVRIKRETFIQKLGQITKSPALVNLFRSSQLASHDSRNSNGHESDDSGVADSETPFSNKTTQENTSENIGADAPHPNADHMAIRIWESFGIDVIPLSDVDQLHLTDAIHELNEPGLLALETIIKDRLHNGNSPLSLVTVLDVYQRWQKIGFAEKYLAGLYDKHGNAKPLEINPSAQPPKQRPRDPIFDEIARGSWGVQDTRADGIELEGGRIAKIKNKVVKADSDVTAQRLVDFYRWYDLNNENAARPRDPDKFMEHYTTYLLHLKQVESVSRQRRVEQQPERQPLTDEQKAEALKVMEAHKAKQLEEARRKYGNQQ